MTQQALLLVFLVLQGWGQCIVPLRSRIWSGVFDVGSTRLTWKQKRATPRGFSMHHVISPEWSAILKLGLRPGMLLSARQLAHSRHEAAHRQTRSPIRPQALADRAFDAATGSLCSDFAGGEIDLKRQPQYRRTELRWRVEQAIPSCRCARQRAEDLNWCQPFWDSRSIKR